MGEENNRFDIRRILVALDASPQSLMRVESAAKLAAGFQAELIGLFVEDVNLLRVAELPFAREVSRFSTTGRRIEPKVLQQELRAQADRIRQALAAAATARGVPWIFKVTRGAVAAEILSAALEADLMILGKMTWAPAGARRLGSSARSILMQGRGLTLILHEQTLFSLPVAVIYDGSDLSKKSLNVAVHLAQAGEDGLQVFILAPDREKAREVQIEVSEKLARQRLKIDYHLLINPSLGSLTRLVQMQARGPLVVPINFLLQGEDLCCLVTDVSNPVFLVR